MSTLREAAQAVMTCWDAPEWGAAPPSLTGDLMDALRAALEQPEQGVAMTDREAMRLALEALNLPSLKTQQMLQQRDEAITALRERLEQQAEPVHGDIRALRYRIFELEGEVIGYKRMLDVAEAPPRHKPLTDEIPIGVLTAITNAKLTLLKTAHGYELRKLGPIVAGLSMKGEA